MNSRKQIGRNLRALREAYGETREELAHVLGYERPSSIKFWEDEERDIPEDAVKTILEHYLIIWRQLYYDDLTSLEKGSLAGNNTPEWMDWMIEPFFSDDIYSVFLPIISSESALADDSFSEAFALHKRILASKSADMVLRFFDNISDCYNKAISRGIDEALVNYVSLILFRCLLVGAEFFEIESVGTAVDFLRSTLSLAHTSQIINKRREIFEEYKLDFDILLKKIRKTKYRDFCDYCIMMKYYLVLEDLSDVGFDSDQTRNVGSVIMEELYRLENPYVKRLIDFFVQSVPESE